MQALTGNPLAVPGILGINAGAAFAMVLSIGVLGIPHPLSLIWLAVVNISRERLNKIQGSIPSRRDWLSPPTS